jgi:hypothetical protein
MNLEHPMNRISFSLCFCFFLCLRVTVSPAWSDVSGIVRDDQGKAIAGAFVRYVAAEDSTREASAFTDDAGRYSFRLPAAGATGLRGISAPYQSRGSAAATGKASRIRESIAYSITGREVRWRSGPVRDGAWLFHGTTGDREPDDRALSKAGAARTFHVTVYGKGVYPLESRNVPIGDTAVRDFSLPAIPLWDSGRGILRSDFAACATRFRTQKQGRVAFLGGSITFNSGWRDSVAAYLKKRFPQTAFEFINAGIPSVGSDMHGFRLHRDVLAKGQIDLLFLESAVNDTTNKVPSLVRKRAYEGIVRQALRSNPAMDIVFLYFLDPSFYPNVKAGKPIPLVTDYEKTAWGYGISSLNLAQSVAERYTWEQFGGDVHPGPFGQGLYAAGIARLLDAAWNAAGAATAPSLPHHVPATMQDSLCYYLGRTDSISKAVIVNGWKRIASWTPAQGGTRDGFVKVPVLESTTPGDTLKFAFTGTAIGIIVPAGYDVGMLDYAIDGKAIGTLDQFTPWSASLHIPWTYLFSGDLAMKSHELRLVNAAGKNAASQGHACRIIRFVVNGPDTSGP